MHFFLLPSLTEKIMQDGGRANQMIHTYKRPTTCNQTDAHMEARKDIFNIKVCLTEIFVNSTSVSNMRKTANRGQTFCASLFSCGFFAVGSRGHPNYTAQRANCSSQDNGYQNTKAMSSKW